MAYQVENRLVEKAGRFGCSIDAPKFIIFPHMLEKCFSSKIFIRSVLEATVVGERSDMENSSTATRKSSLNDQSVDPGAAAGGAAVPRMHPDPAKRIIHLKGDITRPNVANCQLNAFHSFCASANLIHKAPRPMASLVHPMYRSGSMIF